MGYTHYWGNSKETLEVSKLIELRGFLDKVLKKNSRIIQFDHDINQTPELYIDWGKSTVVVRFNGKGVDGHETFIFDNQNEFSFCRTNRKPYGKAVCECLLIISHYLDIWLSSDGWSFCGKEKYSVGDIVKYKDLDENWGSALLNVNKMLKTKYKFIVTEVNGQNGGYFSCTLAEI